MIFVGFSTPRHWNPLSALIRKVQKSPLSHTWLLVEDPLFGLRLVLEAHTTGFRLIALAEFVKDNKVVAIAAPAHSLRHGLPEAGGWLGDKFDVLGLFRIFLIQMGLLFKLVIKPWKPSPHALFCSEAVVRVMKAAEYPGSDTFGDETTTPAALLEFFEKEVGAKVTFGESLNLRTHLKKSGKQKAQRNPEHAAAASSH